MRFFATIAALALAAAVSAQESTTAAATSVVSTTVEPTSTTTRSLTPQETCLAACSDSDICCQAACVNVPCPNEAAVNATTECAGQCVQGNGTQEETEAYAQCQSSCVSSYFLTATSGVPSTATGASQTTGNFDFNESGSSASETASATGSGSSASETGNAAPETRVAIAGAGLFGLLVAGLIM